MPDGAFIPNWLQPADPAGHMATGLQIGARLGEAQARQQFEQMQMLRQEQAQAQEQARWQAEFGLREAEAKRTAEAAARKSAAIMAYQQEVAGGGDPLQAILRYGPAMQEPGTAMGAALRAQLPQKQRIAKVPKFIQGDPETGQPDMIVDQETGALLHVQPIQKGGQLTADDRESLKSARTILNTFEKTYGGAMGAAEKKMDPEGYKAALSEAEAAAQNILEIKGDDPQARRYVAKQSTAPDGPLKFVRDPATGQLVPAGGVSPASTSQIPPPPAMKALSPAALTLMNQSPAAAGATVPNWVKNVGKMPLARLITDQFQPATVP